MAKNNQTQNNSVVKTHLPGMGTILFNGGAAFRVWAPFASSVYVKGTFNNFSETQNAFTCEGNGFWYTEVPNVHIGDEYKFVINNGDTCRRKNPYASKVDDFTTDSNAIIHDPNFDWTGENFTMPAWNELVIYEMHIGTFNCGRNELVGKFNEVISKLDYLQNLGINAIEIMPVAEFPGSHSWGYNPAQPFAVESSLGGPDGLYKFVKEAHKHGIAVILDVVYNHLGPNGLDLYRFDGWFDNNYSDGIYFYDNNRIKTAFGSRPDYGRGEVRQYIRDNALFWLNKYHIDGLRFDSVVNIRNINGNNNDPATDLPDGWSLLQWINNDFRQSQPWKITIAEDLQNNEWITKNTGAGGMGFNSQWDASFLHAIRNAVITTNDADRDMLAIRDALYNRYNADAVQRVVYFESHDEAAYNRLPEAIWPGNANNWFAIKCSTLAAALTFTAPGIPMIFQGAEFLEDGKFSDQTPLDWSHLTLFKGISLLYTDLIKLRRNWKNQTRGLRGQKINVYSVNNNDKLIAYHRWENGGSGDDVIIIANFANQSYSSYCIGMPRGGLWRVRFNSDWNGYSTNFSNCQGYDTVAIDGSKDNLPYQANVGIGPYSVLILSQD